MNQQSNSVHLADGVESLEQLLGDCAQMTRDWPRLPLAHTALRRLASAPPESPAAPALATTPWARASADSARLVDGLSGVGV